MSAYRTSLTLALLFACSTAACSEAPPATPAALESHASAAELVLHRAVAAQEGGADTVTIEAFRRRNPLAYIGLAHNAGVSAFVKARYGRGGTKDNCAALRAAWREARKSVGKDSVHVGGPDAIERHMGDFARMVGCERVIRNTALGPESTAMESTGATTLDATSGDPQPYFDAILLLAQNLPSSVSAYLSQLNGIVTQAEGVLSGNALDGVYAVASVAAESHQYWVVYTGLAPMLDSAVAEYENGQNCNATAEQPNPCTYDQTGLRTPTAYSKPGLFRTVAFGHSAVDDCSRHMNPAEVLDYDIVGAISGFIASGGQPHVAAGASLGASVGRAAYQVLQTFKCLFAE